MFRIVTVSIPFLVCTFWFIQYALSYRKNDRAKRMFTWFLATCVLLYFCHFRFFTVGLSHPMECLWTLCSLSVYPLFFAYIFRLTSQYLAIHRLYMILLPGLLVALAKLFFPSEEIDIVQKIVNSIQILLVSVYGFKRLKAFDKEIAEVYADMEGRDTSALKQLLTAFVLTSICSAIANVIGKRFFADSDFALFGVMMAFSIMLYSLSYICFVRRFSVEQLIIDSPVETLDATDNDEAKGDIGVKFENLMINEQFYLTKNLKINDVSKRLGVCRTYVSNYINQTYGCSFSDYVNKMRVEYAMKLLREDTNTKQIVIAESAGFSSEQSFYRNFRKFIGMSPAEWLRK